MKGTGFHWLASYPRSGNTWVRLLLDSYMRGGAAVDINAISIRAVYRRSFFDDVIGLDSADLRSSEILGLRPAALRAQRDLNDRPLLMKCHDMRWRLADGDWLIPADVSLGGIYLVRDPRDVVLSLAKFFGRSVDHAITTMETTGLLIPESKRRDCHQLPQIWGSWSENVESWLALEPFPVHVVRYDDLRRDTAKVLTGIIDAIGLDLDETRIAAAVAATDLEGLRREERSCGFVETGGHNDFFGDGRIGGWRDRLSADQAARIEAVHGPTMRRLGYLE